MTDISAILDKNGKIAPSHVVLKHIVQQYPGLSPAEKWRLAQIETLFDYFPELTPMLHQGTPAADREGLVKGMIANTPQEVEWAIDLIQDGYPEAMERVAADLAGLDADHRARISALSGINEVLTANVPDEGDEESK